MDRNGRESLGGQLLRNINYGVEHFSDLIVFILGLHFVRYFVSFYPFKPDIV